MESLFAFVAASVAVGNVTASLAAHQTCNTGIPRTLLGSTRRCSESTGSGTMISGSAATTTWR